MKSIKKNIKRGVIQLEKLNNFNKLKNIKKNLYLSTKLSNKLKLHSLDVYDNNTLIL